jgi:hypothetical protein
MSTFKIVPILAISFMVSACAGVGGNFFIADDGSQSRFAVKGDRLLGVGVSTNSETGTLGESIAHIKSAGAVVVPVEFNWNTIESGTRNYSDPGGMLALLNTLLSTRQVKLSLTVAAIDKASAKLPADLAGLSFSSGALTSRYNEMLNFVFSKLPNVEIIFVGVGSEVDLYSQDPTFATEFSGFLGAVKNHVHSQRPASKVGVSATLQGLFSDSRDEMLEINTESDVVAVTYYPLNADASVKQASAPATDLPLVLELYPDREIFLVSTAYPSSSGSGSDETKQSNYVKELFRVWDVYSDRWLLTCFAALTDLSRTQAEALATSAGRSDESFIEFIRSMGLRTYPQSGTDKPAFITLKETAKLRGF